MRFQTRLKPCFNLIDLTPLVDVIFLMLIFFLITSDILPLKSLSIENPPLANKNSEARMHQLIVIMDKDQVIYVGSKKEIIDMGSVKEHLCQQIAALKAQNPHADPAVVLHIDRHVDYAAFLRLFSVVQECSSHIRLAYNNVT